MLYKIFGISLIFFFNIVSYSFAAMPPSETVEVTPIEAQSLGFKENQNTENVGAKIVSVDFKDVDVRNALRCLGLQQDINIIPSPEVKGTVTIHLSDVMLEQALSFIVESVNADFVIEGNVVRVFMASERKEKTLPYILKINNGKMTLNARDVDVRLLLQDIALKSGLSVVFDKSLEGTVSLTLKDVPVKDGMIFLVENNGYVWEEIQGVYRIGKDKKRRYSMKVDEIGNVSIDAAGGDLKEILREISLRTNINIVTCGNVQAEVNCNIVTADYESLLRLVLIGTKYQYKKIGDVFVVGDEKIISSEVVSLKGINSDFVMEKLPSYFDKSNIKVLEGQNAIVVSGSQDNINNFKEFISKMEVSIQEVSMDILVVEYPSSFDKKAFGLSFDDVSLGGAGTVYIPEDFKFGTENMPMDFPYYLLAKMNQEMFKLYLYLLVKEGHAKICANPTVKTLNGRDVIIDVTSEHMGEDQALKDRKNYKPDDINFNIKFKLTPSVSQNDEINVTLEPEISFKDKGKRSFFVDKRKAKTTMKVDSGGTIIVGGVIQSVWDELNNRKNKNKKIKLQSGKELIFYITPSIIKDGKLVKKEEKIQNPLYVEKRNNPDGKPVMYDVVSQNFEDKEINGKNKKTNKEKEEKDIKNINELGFEVNVSVKSEAKDESKAPAKKDVKSESLSEVKGAAYDRRVDLGKPEYEILDRKVDKILEEEKDLLKEKEKSKESEKNFEF